MLTSKQVDYQSNPNALTMFDFSSIDLMDPSLGTNIVKDYNKIYYRRWIENIV